MWYYTDIKAIKVEFWHVMQFTLSHKITQIIIII